MKLINKLSLLLLFTGISSLFAQQQNFDIKWNYGHSYNGKDDLSLKLTLINQNDQAFQLKDYALWFNSMYPIKEGNFGDFSIHNRNGNLYSIDFNRNTSLASKDSLQIDYQSPYPIAHISLTPNGFYLQNRKNDKQLIPIADPQITPLSISAEEQRQFLAALYDKIDSRQADTTQLILPTPLKIRQIEGSLTLQNEVSYYIDEAFNWEMASFQEFAQQLQQLQFVEAGEKEAQVKVLYDKNLGEEEYKLTISEKGLVIEAGKGSGAFYALQTIKSLLPSQALSGEMGIKLPALTIHDKPRYAYRGFMMDIARNFKDKQVILKYLDLMALYKLNTLHLHLIDDEGWRLEIPSLPELTEIGSVRSPYFADGNSLQPAYGSASNTTKGHFLSKADFQEILKYAAARYITVIPEIETPGHARAAIKAMETRYKRLMKQGKKAEAKAFLLYEAADESQYSSAQYWDDNVMNPAMPSVYHFIDVVLDDIKAMYTEAGLTLKTVSLGGDEVPAGSWEKSPLIKALMAKEGFSSVYEVWPYYIQKIQQICASKGLQMAGWEEIGMVNKGSGMVVNEKLAHLDMMLDVWNNVIGGGQEDLAYKLANAGYKTIFTSSANYYLDMVWDRDFREPGLKWASISDLYQAFALLPEDFFANLAHTEAGSLLKPEYLNAKTRLTEKGKSNLVGLKAALWQETVLDEARMDYMILPRIFALAERAWRPAYPFENEHKFNKDAFLKAYGSFARKVGVELPKLQTLAGTFQYRLPSVGLKQVGNKLMANMEYPGFALVYTIDGSDPNANAQLFPTNGLPVRAGQRVKIASMDKDQRIGRISEYLVP